MLSRCRSKKSLAVCAGTFAIGLLVFLACGANRVNGIASGWFVDECEFPETASSFQPPGYRFPDAEHYFLTDRGSRLPVFNWVAPAEEYANFAYLSDRAFRQRFSLTATSPPTSQANCHGWVFLRGRFLIFAEQVECILRENGYQTVANPQVGDVIIYRNSIGEILHSGLVWWVGANGRILIHSKFGVSGRYLHAPAEQPYGHHYSYYRADRRRHAVRVRAAETAVQP